MRRKWIEADRPLTERERTLLRKALERMRTGEQFGGGNWVDIDNGARKPLESPANPESFLAQIDGLRVRAICPCGEKRCETVRFISDIRDHETGVAMTTEAKKLVIAHIDHVTRELVGLEVV